MIFYIKKFFLFFLVLYPGLSYSQVTVQVINYSTSNIRMTVVDDGNTIIKNISPSSNINDINIGSKQVGNYYGTYGKPLSINLSPLDKEVKIGTWDQDGYPVSVGSAKEFINSAGSNYMFMYVYDKETKHCSTPYNYTTHGQYKLAYSSSSVPHGSSCFGRHAACVNGVYYDTEDFSLFNINDFPYSSCVVLPPPSNCTSPWGTTVNNGSSVTAYQTSSVPFGSSCTTVSETRACTNGTLSGSYTNQSCTVAAAANCTSQALNWGTSNFCSASATATLHNGALTLTNTATGASGSATATCNNGAWSLSGTSCTVSLLPPSSLSATDGTVTNAINVTFGSISGATGYDLQYRKQGTTTWTAITGVTSGYSFSTTEQGLFEFQVRSKNALGASAWSATETGYINGSCALPWGGTTGHGSTVTAYQTSSVPFGSTCVQETRACNYGTLSGGYVYNSCGQLPQDNSATIGLIATDGTISNAIQLNWAVSNGATSYDLQYRKQGTSTWTNINSPTNSYIYNTTDYSVFEFQVRAKNNFGTTPWSAIETGFSAKTCAPKTVNWGASNYCAYAISSISNVGQVITGSNTTAGATGSMTATCNGLTGNWDISATTCDVSLAKPSALTFTATDGAVSYGINLSWSAISGAQNYTLESRKQGTTTWNALATPTATSYSWTGLSDESVYEFRLKANNAVGSGEWSDVETGYIRKLLDPKFISETGIPAKIGVNQTFVVSQVWRNGGAETWTSTTHGTGPSNPQNTTIWNLGNINVSSNVTLDTNVTINGTAKAPATPGNYTFQRLFQKSGTSLGVVSPSHSVLVLGSPTCSTVTPEISSTYDRKGSVKVTIAGVNQNETVELKVWSDVNGQDDIRTYNPTMKAEGIWEYTVPLANHTGYGKLNLVGVVGNEVFGKIDCATGSLNIDELPVPTLSLQATQGNFGTNGYVLNVNDNVYAQATVNTPGFTSLKTRIELLNANNALMQTASGISHNTPSPINANNIFAANAQAWQTVNATLKVIYEDPAAAEQGKVATLPIQLMLPPKGMAVTSGITETLPYRVIGNVRKGGVYDALTQGEFTGKVTSDGVSVATAPKTIDGSLLFSSLDTSTLYGKANYVVAVAIPPAGTTLVQPIEFVSNAVELPVTAPINVSATDDVYEDDIEITWANSLPSSVPGVTYLVYRNGTLVTPESGIAQTNFTDINIQQRGVPHSYTVKAMVNNRQSVSSAADNGSVPLCRAVRLVGTSLNADMTAMNGMLEQWSCLTGVNGKGGIDAAPQQAFTINGSPSYTSFSVPVGPSVTDGAHTLNLTFNSPSVTINQTRTYAVPFVLDRASITIDSMSITYNGAPAASGQESDSIGRFGVKMIGGSGIGFAQPIAP